MPSIYARCAIQKVFAIAALCSFVLAQTPDPISARCARWYHQSTIKGSTLYINGGVETYTSGSADNILVGNNQELITIDLSNSWDAKDKLPQSSVEKAGAPGTGMSPPSLVQGAMFSGASSDPKLFVYGGTTSMVNTSFPGYMSNNPKGAALWSYDTSTQAWFQFSTDNQTYRPSWGAAAEAPNLGLGFYFNGQIDEFQMTQLGPEKIPISGMMVVDANNHATRNISTTSITTENPRRGGSLQYLSDVGTKGSLIEMGGIVAASAAHNDGWPDFKADLSQITIFDVGSLDKDPDAGTWYTQPATGDIPAGRIDFCLVAASAADGSSHNIYMYGGRDPFYNTPFDDVYVLSLPSFTWTMLYNGTSPRFGHTCHLVGNSQMLRVGGSLTNDKWAIMNIPSTAMEINNSTLNTTVAKCDTETNGVSVFDLTQATWGSAYDPKGAAYGVPQKVIDKIGGSASGHAKMLQPSAGFAQSGVADLFKASSKTSSNSTATPSATPSPQHSSDHAGVIAGAVVGGLAALAIIAGIFFLCSRRNRKRQSPSPESGGKDHLPSLEIDGGPKSPPEMSSPDHHPARMELLGSDGVHEKGDHDMWDKSRRVYGNGNGIVAHEKGDGVVHEKEGDATVYEKEADADGELYRDDQAKRDHRGELDGSEVNELDGSTVAGGTERGNSLREREGEREKRGTVHEMES